MNTILIGKLSVVVFRRVQGYMCIGNIMPKIGTYLKNYLLIYCLEG